MKQSEQLAAIMAASAAIRALPLSVEARAWLLRRITGEPKP